jgi:hypothetical protein
MIGFIPATVLISLSWLLCLWDLCALAAPVWFGNPHYGHQWALITAFIPDQRTPISPSRNHGIETYGSLRNQRIGYCDCFVWLQTHRQIEFWIRMKRTRSPPWPAFSSFVRERNKLQANYGPRKGQRAHMIDIHTVTVYQCP